jgi:hypothetical protein
MGGDRNGITVIEGGCPCMFNPTADPGHKAMRFVFTLTGNMRRRVLRHGRGCQRASAGRGESGQPENGSASSAAT